MTNILSLNANKEEVKKEITTQVANLVSIYENYEAEMNKVEDILDKKLNNQRKQFLRISLLYFIAHLVVFYALIYQFYGWDTIEPITYIVGNIYWIIAIGFFIKTKKKLDMSYFISDTFSKSFYSKQYQRFNFNKSGYQFTRKYIQNLKDFNSAIEKI